MLAKHQIRITEKDRKNKEKYVSNTKTVIQGYRKTQKDSLDYIIRK